MIPRPLSLLSLIAVGALGAQAQEPSSTPEDSYSESGKGRFVYEARDKAIEVFTYRPEAKKGGEVGPLLVVMHGMDRNADEYRDRAVGMAERFGALVVAPCFDLEQFPVEAYQRGGVTLDREPQSREEWTFQYIVDIVEEIRRREERPDMPYYLIGHSAGGQFLTRLAAFLPGGAERIVAGNPGSLIFPTRELPFQYGFGNLPDELSDDAALRAYLAAPLTLFLGTADTGAENLDQSEAAKRQGPTRIARGRACYAMGEALARERGWPFAWRLVEAEGVAHSSAALFDHELVAEALFGLPSPSASVD